MALRSDSRATRSHSVVGKFLVDGLIVTVYGDRVCQVVGNHRGHTLRRLDDQGRANFTIGGTTSPGRHYGELVRNAVVQVSEGGLCWAKSYDGKFVEVEPNWRNKLILPEYFIFPEADECPVSIPPEAFICRTNASTFYDKHYARELAVADWMRWGEHDAGMPHPVKISARLKEAMHAAARIGTILALKLTQARAGEYSPAEVGAEIQAAMMARLEGRQLPKGFELVVLPGVSATKGWRPYRGGSAVALVKTADPWLPAAIVGVHSQFEFAPKERIVACGYYPDGEAFCRHSRVPQGDFWSTSDRGHWYGSSSLVRAIGLEYMRQHAPAVTSTTTADRGAASA